MPKFTHPTVRKGQITHDGEEYAIENGVVDCPAHVAAQVHGLRAVVATAEDAPEADLSVDPDASVAPSADEKKRRK